MSKIFDNLTLCTFSSGRTMVREVLEDWLHFLGGRPKHVLFAVTPSVDPPPIYEELHREGLIDRILYLDAGGRSVREVDSDALRLIIDAAPTEWVLLFKLDTLPYRRGNENWLDEALDRVMKHQLFGMTGGFPIKNLIPLEDGYSTTQKYSNNFSMFRRSAWLNVINSAVGDGGDKSAENHSRFQGDELRYLNEYVIETHMEQTGKRMLVKHDTRDWSVFHVNVWGEALRKVRIPYQKRRGVKRFFNTGKPLRRPIRYPWQEYFGYPRPPMVKLMRIVLGRWRRSLFRPKG